MKNMLTLKNHLKHLKSKRDLKKSDPAMYDALFSKKTLISQMQKHGNKAIDANRQLFTHAIKNTIKWKNNKI